MEVEEEGLGAMGAEGRADTSHNRKLWSRKFSTGTLLEAQGRDEMVAK